MNNDPGVTGEVASPELAPSESQQQFSRDEEELPNPVLTEATEGSTYEEGDVSIDVPLVATEEDTGSPSGPPGPDDVFSPLGEEEPSLALPPMMPPAMELDVTEEEALALASEREAVAQAGFQGQAMPGDEIEFPSSRNSPDMPGASSVYLSHWEAREESRPHSPRSEHSDHSSIYQGASARTSMNGAYYEPRALIRSTDAKPGLETGDVVMLLSKGRPYIAVQAQLPYKQDKVHTVLDLAGDEHLAPEREGLAYLEVIKQGPFLGFRSSAAGNRFMQPRRKAPHRLVFFNFNCGVWEQWEVLASGAGEGTAAPGCEVDWRTAAWSQAPLVFRSRRMPQVQLAVDVVRVGLYSLPGSGAAAAGGGGMAVPTPGAAPGPIFAPTPRSFMLPMIPEEGNIEDQNLRRISNVLVLEWFKFVDHEKVLREGLEADLAALLEEMAQLKLNTISQVEFLRVYMNEEITALLHHVTSRDTLIATLRAWLRHTQQVAADHMARLRHRRVLTAWRNVVDDIVYHKAAILKLRRKHCRELRDRAFWAWYGHARGAAGASTKLIFAVQRRSHALMSRVMLGWQAVIEHHKQAVRAVAVAVQRRAHRLMSTSLHAWRILVAQLELGRAALQRALSAVRQCWLTAAFTAWRGAVASSLRTRVQVEQLAARRSARVVAAALGEWRAVARSRRALRMMLVTHCSGAVMRRAFGGWRGEAVAAGVRRCAAAALGSTWGTVHQRLLLRSWLEVAVARRTTRWKLLRHVAARSELLLGRVLYTWQAVMQEARRRRMVLLRHVQTMGTRKLAIALIGWRSVTSRMSGIRKKMVAAVTRLSTRRMSSAFLWWRTYAAARRALTGRAALAGSKLRRLRLEGLFGAWRDLAARFAAARRGMAAACRRMQTATLSALFRHWHLVTKAANTHRRATARALPASTRDLLARILAMWWARHCASAGSILDSASGGAARDPAYYAAAQAERARQAALRSGAAAAGPGAGATGAGVPSRPVAQQSGGPAAVVHLPQGASVPPTRRPNNAQVQLSSSSPSGGAATGGAAGLTVMASPTRPPLHPGSAAVSPRSTRDSSSGSGLPSAADAAAVLYSTTTVTPQRRVSSGDGVSYRDALSAAAAATARTPSPSRPGGHSAAGSRSSSAGRTRGSGSGMVALPHSSPFIPANSPVIGAGSSPVVVEMAPGRGAEQPQRLTPIGLAELLDDEDANGEPGELEAMASVSGYAEGGLGGMFTSPTRDVGVEAALQPERLSGEEEGGGFAGFGSPAGGSGAVAWGPGFGPGSGGLGRWLAAAVVTEWRQVAATRREWRKLTRRVVMGRWQKMAGRILTALRERVSLSRKLSGVAEVLGARIRSANNRRLLEDVFKAWQGAARRKKLYRTAISRFKLRTAQSTAQLALLEWHQLAAVRAATKRRVARLVARRSFALASAVFLAWHHTARAAAERRTIAVDQACRRSKELLYSALSGWCGAAAERRARAARDARAARFARRRRLAGVFSGWRSAAEAAAHRALVAESAGRSVALRTAFGGWLQMASSGPRGFLPVALEASMQRAAGWRDRRLLRVCFNAFADNRTEQQLLKRHAAAIRGKAEAATRAAILASWRTEAGAARRAGVEILKMSARRCRRTAARCFAAWRDLVDVKAAARQAAAALALQSDAGLLAFAFEAWQEAVQTAKAGRAAAAQRSAADEARLAAAVKRLSRGSVWRAFEEWRQYVARRRLFHSKVLAVWHRVESVLARHVLAAWADVAARSSALRAEAAKRFAAGQRGLMALAFCGWQDTAACLRAARAKAASRGLVADRALLRNTWEAWCELAEAAKRRAEAAEWRAVVRRAGQLPSMLRSWAALALAGAEARRLQRVALGHLLLRRYRATLRQAFDTWRGVVADRLTREEELRRCIKRKKLAFSLFKQWYWEAFDSDVQATIRRMFHSTDPAAHSPDPSRRYTAVHGASAAAMSNTYDQQHQHTQMTRHVYMQPQPQLYGQYGMNAMGTAAPRSSVAGLPVGPGAAVAGLQSRLLQVQQQQLHSRQMAVSSTTHTANATTTTARTLAPSFDAMAGGTAGRAMPAATPMQPGTAAAALSAAAAATHAKRTSTVTVSRQVAASTALTNAAALLGRAGAAVVAPRSTLGSIQLHSDSEDSDDPDTLGALRGGAAAAVPAPAPAAAGGGGGTRRGIEQAASFGSWAQLGGRAAAPGFAAPAAAATDVTARTAGALAASVNSARAAATAAAAAAAAPAGSSATTYEAVTAMNAVLVNVANQLTEVSRASLEIAAGVVAGGAGGGLLSPNAARVFGTGGGTGPGSVASGGAAPGSGGAKLPGVVPTWRQVASNQLYDELYDGEHGGDGAEDGGEAADGEGEGQAEGDAGGEGGAAGALKYSNAMFGEEGEGEPEVDEGEEAEDA
ncbi:hypothetical protein HYH02_006686 [Chlamydomonas schloesseri]|uniref:Sfi1 spindle body domain-containing protein n=1 Tax=Chlamydomonas schloesseri TaxID=2026947 RepID=A0A835W0I3_9CHLO|nr:hypothetical protein HYH02_006686 [Chlamydomonas schloesseri]|eukprot:KAG2432703.1 hypothetical protein HYH02_006686 [Chlamydomonas schloesseri]